MTRTPQVQDRHSGRITRWAGHALVLIGASVLTGWALDVLFLKASFGEITMKPNAAVGLVTAGVALQLWRREGRLSRVGWAVGFIPGLIGAATLSQHIFGWNLGIDQLLFSEAPGAAGTASPGRMGPNTSLSLTLASAALRCLYGGGPGAVARAQGLGIAIALLALVPAVGYLYGATQLFAIARITGIGFVTSIGLLVLSGGILAARPDVAPVSAIAGDAPHAVMARRLLAAAFAFPLLLGYLRVAGERHGLYDTGFGAAAFAIAMITLMSITIWRTALALARSDRERRSVEEALTETEERFRQMADQAPVLIWVEERGNRVWFNKPWYEFTGAAPGTTDWQALVHPDDLRDYAATVRSAATAHASYSHQYRLRCATGGYAWILETATPRSAGDGFTGYVGSCVDVTTLRQAEQQREDLLRRERMAREKAEGADRAKDEFLAALSHELRTPLNAIVGWTQMLQHGIGSEEGRSRAVEAVARNADALRRLIEDLLDTSRITNGQLEISPSPIDVASVVRAAVESVLPAATSRGITVAVRTAEAPPIIMGDAHRLQQVIANLLANAIKFSRHGSSVDVDVSGGADTAVVCVRDYGAGIDPAFLPHVFDRFRQGSSDTGRQDGGLGLGLFIARHLVERHGGTLEVQSGGRGSGSAFTMTLPAAIGNVPGSTLATGPQSRFVVADDIV